MAILQPLTRRQFLTRAALFTATSGALAKYATSIEPEWLELTHKTYTHRRSPLREPISVLHLSDLHLSQVVSVDYINDAFTLGLEQKPDLIFLTGDYITHSIHNRSDYIKALSRLSAAAPTFATCGNHDGGVWMKRRHGHYPDTKKVESVLHDANIVVLKNSFQDVRVRDSLITIVGLEDLWSGKWIPTEAFLELEQEREHPTVVLSHNPDTKDLLESFHWDLMFSGHTHGGQVKLPILGAVMTPSNPLFSEGLRPWGNRHIHITRGIGSIFGVRINCRPEVSIVKVV